MVNQSQKSDPRYWNKWTNSGAIGFNKDVTEMKYMIGIVGEMPTFDPRFQREEKIGKMKEYAKGLYFTAREKLQNYPEIEILNDELFLVYALLARSPVSYVEKTFKTEIIYNDYGFVMKSAAQIPDDLKGIVRSIKTVRKIIPM